MSQPITNGKRCIKCGSWMVWENPCVPGHWHASSCNLDDSDICADCMGETDSISQDQPYLFSGEIV